MNNGVGYFFLFKKKIQFLLDIFVNEHCFCGRLHQVPHRWAKIRRWHILLYILYTRSHLYLFSSPHVLLLSLLCSPPFTCFKQGVTLTPSPTLCPKVWCHYMTAIQNLEDAYIRCLLCYRNNHSWASPLHKRSYGPMISFFFIMWFSLLIHYLIF
jgi:hypothetical protein